MSMMFTVETEKRERERESCEAREGKGRSSNVIFNNHWMSGRGNGRGEGLVGCFLELAWWEEELESERKGERISLLFLLFRFLVLEASSFLLLLDIPQQHLS